MVVIEPKTVILKNGQKACIRTRKLEDAEKVLNCVEEIFADDHFFMTTIEEIREKLTLEKYTERTELFNSRKQKLLLVDEVDGEIVSLSDVECGEKNAISMSPRSVSVSCRSIVATDLVRPLCRP